MGTMIPSALDIAMRRAESHPIPPITDPMGKSWNQPERKFIEIDETHALMSRATFGALADYSGSIPTGVYPGKMWKRHDGLWDRDFLARGGKPVWKLVWYGTHADPTKCSINFRTILIADESEEVKKGRIGLWERP